MEKQATTSIICFGEVLWDIFPEYNKPGGAPLNVAYHLNRMGIDSQIVSKVGKDKLGQQLLQQMKDWGISSRLCQQDANHATGIVKANMDGDYEVNYEIVAPVAWDYIQLSDECFTEVAQADAFVFGSLVMRNDVSRTTLFKLLSAAKYKVFDVNLRPPHFNCNQIISVLEQTDLLKLNQNELNIISGWCSQKVKEDTDKIRLIQQHYGIEDILLTKGGQGSCFYQGDKCYNQVAYKIKVKDTVGSGDAFLSGFLADYFKKDIKINKQLETAATLGAFVASKSGACPDYSIEELKHFKQNIIFD